MSLLSLRRWWVRAAVSRVDIPLRPTCGLDKDNGDTLGKLSKYLTEEGKCTFLLPILSVNAKIKVGQNIAVAQRTEDAENTAGSGKNNGGKRREHSQSPISVSMCTFLTFLSSLPEFKSHSKGLGHRQGYRLGL